MTALDPGPLILDTGPGTRHCTLDSEKPPTWKLRTGLRSLAKTGLSTDDRRTVRVLEGLHNDGGWWRATAQEYVSSPKNTVYEDDTKIAASTLLKSAMMNA
ncbi:hypothetical protein N7513_004304 [Penicillium frequentans]|nr:hypothetical protein N7513_004304 [Penicillium glabrum]